MSSFEHNTHLFLVTLAGCVGPNGQLLEFLIQITAVVWLTIVKPSGLHVCRVGRRLMHLMHVVICLVLELIVSSLSNCFKLILTISYNCFS